MVLLKKDRQRQIYIFLECIEKTKAYGMKRGVTLDMFYKTEDQRKNK